MQTTSNATLSLDQPGSDPSESDLSLGDEVVAPTSSLDIKARQAEMRAAWRSGERDAAIGAADAILEQFPRSGEALKMRLAAAIKAEEPDLIASAAIAVADTEPKLALEAVNKLVSVGEAMSGGHVLLALREADAAAVEGFSEAAAQVASTLLNVAIRHRRSGDEEGSVPLFCLGAAVDPENAALRKQVALLRADFIQQAKRADAAMDPEASFAAWTRVAEVDPQHIGALKRLATASDKGDDSDYSMELWARILELDPGNEVAAPRLARAAGLCGREHEALAILCEAGLAPSGERYVTRLEDKVLAASNVALIDGDAIAAARNLSLLIRQGRRDPRVQAYTRKTVALLSRKTRAFIKAEQPKIAAQFARALVQLDPDSALALAVLARYCYKEKLFADAAAHYQRLTEVAPNEATNWLHLARALSRAGDGVGAADAAERALALAPGGSHAEPQEAKNDL